MRRVFHSKGVQSKRQKEAGLLGGTFFMAEMKEAHTHDAHIYPQFHMETVDKRSHAPSPINYGCFLKVPVGVKFTTRTVCLHPAK